MIIEKCRKKEEEEEEEEGRRRNGTYIQLPGGQASSLNNFGGILGVGGGLVLGYFGGWYWVLVDLFGGLINLVSW